MSDLIEFRNIADEITIRENDGVAIVSIRGAARLAGIHHTSVARGGALRSSKLAKKAAEQGVDTGALSTGQVTDEVLEVILGYYAFDADRHCTEQAKHAYRQFAKIGIRAACYAAKGLVEFKSPHSVVKVESAEPKPELPPAPELIQPDKEKEPVSSVDEFKGVFGVAMSVLEGVQIGGTSQQDNNLKTQAAIAAAQAHCPHLAAAFEPVLHLLKQADAKKIVYLTPTSLGQLAGGISAREMNRLLAEMGLQVRNQGHAKTEPAWLPTKLGWQYAKVLPVTASNGDMTTYQCLRWSEDVVNLLKGNVTA